MNVSTCDASVIEGYLNDTLSPAGETAFERHLDSCTECRKAMADGAGSGDDWTDVTTALRPDMFDQNVEATVRAPAWPLSLLGPTDDPCMLGRIGPFEVSGCVGVGGMGVVFKARDPALDRFVAVKVLSPQLAASESARIRFAREARAAAAVVHDNVIAVYQVAEYQGLPYLVMPYLPGPSLEERIRRHGPMPVVAALRVARQVAAGLNAAHQQGLIHRDIKPANILLSADTERAIITDFGLARAADDATLTRSGALAGTPQFMAPEQARGEPADTQSDLFSLGALLFAMLTGQAPVSHLPGAETIRQVGSMAPPTLSSVCLDVPKWLGQLVGAIHCFDPNRRMVDAQTAEQQLAMAVSKAGNRPLTLRANRADTNSGAGKKLVVAVLVVLFLVPLSWWMLSQPTVVPSETLQSSRQVQPQADAADGPPDTKPVNANASVPPDSEEKKIPVPKLTDLSGSELDEMLKDIRLQMDALDNR